MNEELTLEIKSMDRIQKEQANHLEKLHERTDFVNKIKSLSEETRTQKHRIRELEAKLRNEHEEKRSLNKRIDTLEKQNLELEDKLNGKTGEFITKESIEETNKKMAKLINENAVLKKINEGQMTKYIKQNSRHLKEITKMKESLANRDK